MTNKKRTDVNITEDMEKMAKTYTNKQINYWFRRTKNDLSEPKKYANQIYATKHKKETLIKNIKTKDDNLRELAERQLKNVKLPILSQAVVQGLNDDTKKKVLKVVKPRKEKVAEPVKKAPKANASKQTKIDFMMSEEGYRANPRFVQSVQAGNSKENQKKANKLISSYRTLVIRNYKADKGFDLIKHMRDADKWHLTSSKSVIDYVEPKIEQLKKQYIESVNNPKRQATMTRHIALQATFYELMKSFNGSINTAEFKQKADEIFEKKTQGKYQPLTNQEKEDMQKGFIKL